MKGIGINDNSALEQEADIMGARAIGMNSDGKTSPAQLKNAQGTVMPLSVSKSAVVKCVCGM